MPRLECSSHPGLHARRLWCGLRCLAKPHSPLNCVLPRPQSPRSRGHLLVSASARTCLQGERGDKSHFVRFAQADGSGTAAVDALSSPLQPPPLPLIVGRLIAGCVNSNPQFSKRNLRKAMPPPVLHPRPASSSVTAGEFAVAQEPASSGSDSHASDGSDAPTLRGGWYGASEDAEPAAPSAVAPASGNGGGAARVAQPRHDAGARAGVKVLVANVVVWSRQTKKVLVAKRVSGKRKFIGAIFHLPVRARPCVRTQASWLTFCCTWPSKRLGCCRKASGTQST